MQFDFRSVEIIFPGPAIRNCIYNAWHDINISHYSCLVLLSRGFFVFVYIHYQHERCSVTCIFFCRICCLYMFSYITSTNGVLSSAWFFCHFFCHLCCLYMFSYITSTNGVLSYAGMFCHTPGFSVTFFCHMK